MKRPRLSGQQALIIVLIGIASTLLLYKLGSLLPGLAAGEQPLPPFKSNAQMTWDKPILLPFKISQLLVAAILPTGGYTASRLPAVLLGMGILLLMFWLLKQWYGQRLAIFGTALLMTAPWLLHVSRLADGSVSYPFAMTVILALAVAWHQKKRRLRLLYSSAIVTAITLYVPGIIWLVLCLVAVEHRNMWVTFKTGKRHAVFASVLGLVGLAPLVHSLVLNWHTYQLYLGWRGSWPTLSDYPWQFVTVWRNIFINGYRNPLYNLGTLPVVSILMALAFIIGLYLYGQHLKAARTRLLALLWLIGTALISLPHGANIALILPILLVLATGGLGYLLHLWLKVFPRNPLARSFGIGLIALMVLFGAAYNIRNYFVAWPHNSDTKAAFTHRLD